MHNPELELARAFVRDTNRSLFLTGKAGTGKTTFLHRLRTELHKRLVVTAPTGVAAINAGGVTLHSFFQLPFGPFVPGGEAERQLADRRFNREKRDIIRSLDLLIIDEISMVRGDLLDAVDFVLRHQRGSDRPFGGVQLLMIGDLHQLPPVVTDQDWAILQDHYPSGYFFSSRALAATDLVTVELKRIYRQSDADFIALLNAVRDNCLDERALEQLNARYRPDFRPDDQDGYITLTTHNRGADRINDGRLAALTTKARDYVAEIEGDYPAQNYPTAATLTLKPGAQVMFVRNDSGEDKRFFNGKIGAVTRLERGRILVRCPGDDAEIAVEPVTWENIRYSLDPATKEITEEVIGKFTQYPLRLAWAITIHKSQGLTFERAIIDAAAAFSHGQVYVGLSRCKTLEGLVLSAPIPRHAVKTDQRVSHYVDAVNRQPPTQEQLEVARRDYQQRLMLACWDFDALGIALRRLLGLVRENARVIDQAGGGENDRLEHQVLTDIVRVAAKFRQQLRGLFPADGLPEHDEAVQERVRKAAVYFSAKLGEGLGAWLAAVGFETDNKALGKTLSQRLEALRTELRMKTAAVESCREGFAAERYLSALAKARITDPPRTKPAGVARPGGVKTAEDPLLVALRAWRAEKEAEETSAGLGHYRVLTRALLREIATHRPKSAKALSAIRGIGRSSRQRYGKEILALVAAHPRPAEAPKPGRESPKAGQSESATKQTSLQLYREGLDIAEIARRRSLAASTIEGHLAHYIAKGELAIGDFVSAERVALIAEAFAELGTAALTPVKEALGEDVSFGELRMVQAHLQRQG